MENEAPQNKAIFEAPKAKYHFAGTPDYKPSTVEASSPEEAQEIWQKTRELVVPQKPAENKIN